jgi:hypothetical protein
MTGSVNCHPERKRDFSKLNHYLDFLSMDSEPPLQPHQPGGLYSEKPSEDEPNAYA